VSVTSPDVVVIGAGIVGTSAATFLAAAGLSVVIVEQEAIAAAASGRNSGVIQHPFDPVLAALHRESLDLYRELAASSAGEAEPFLISERPAGLLLVSTDADGTERMTREVATSNPQLEPSFLGTAELHRLEPAIGDGVVACRLDIGYPVEPGAATRAYAALAGRHGASIVTGAAAALLIEDDRAVGVRVGDDVIRAGSVVVAAGAWTPEVFDATRRWQPIVRSWGVVAEVDLDRPPGHVLEEAEIDAAIEPRDDPEYGDLPGVAFSLATARGSRGAMSGLGSTFLAERPDPADYVPALVARGSRFVPAIASARLRGVRICPRPVSLDGRPLVGPVPWLPGATVAAGHGPWGISTGPATGRMVADLVLGRDAAIPAGLDPARFGSPG
jgi:glycine/D-amino acid oxidase-like deaminating enzyme